jgi:hypothetical protein
LGDAGEVEELFAWLIKTGLVVLVLVDVVVGFGREMYDFAEMGW